MGCPGGPTSWSLVAADRDQGHRPSVDASTVANATLQQVMRITDLRECAVLRPSGRWVSFEHLGANAHALLTFTTSL